MRLISTRGGVLMEKSILNHIEIFERVPHSILSLIEDKIEVNKVKRGQYIFHETEKAIAVYFVIDGLVKMKQNNYKGKEVVVSIKRKGDIFGEATLYQPEQTGLYHETAQALTKVTIGSILRSELEDMILNSPQLAKNIIQTMSANLGNFSNIIKDYTLSDVYGKTIKTLERLGQQYGKYQNEGPLIIDIPLSVQELANIVGTTRESESRIVTKLKEEGLITINKRRVTINNWFHFRTISRKI